jgi:hypothetical protein
MILVNFVNLDFESLRETLEKFGRFVSAESNPNQSFRAPVLVPFGLGLEICLPKNCTDIWERLESMVKAKTVEAWGYKTKTKIWDGVV